MQAWRRLFFSEVFWHTGVAFFDRALLSATNFAIGVLLIRGASAANYGLFALANSAILLGTSFQNALITTPMTVLAAKREWAERQHFVSALAIGQYLIWLPLCLLVGVLAVFGPYFHLSVATTEIALGTSLVTLFVFLREFIRRAFFVYALPLAVLSVDVVYVIVFLSLFYLVTIMASPLALHAITAMGVAELLAGIFGLALFHRHIGWKFSSSFRPLSLNWRHGKWALMAVSVGWLASEGFLYLLGGVKGTVAVANLSATRLLLMPIALILFSTESILRPRGAAWLAGGEKRKMLQSAALLTVGTCIAAVVYTGILLLTYGSVAAFVFKKEITDIKSLLILWGAIFLLQSIRSNFSTLLQIFERFDRLFFIEGVSTIVSLSIGYWAIHAFGAPGALVGRLVGEVAILLGIAWTYRREQLGKVME